MSEAHQILGYRQFGCVKGAVEYLEKRFKEAKEINFFENNRVSAWLYETISAETGEVIHWKITFNKNGKDLPKLERKKNEETNI